MSTATPQQDASKNSPFEEISDTNLLKDIINTFYKKSIPLNFWGKDKAKLQFEAKISGVTKERIFLDLPSIVSLNVWDEMYSHAANANNPDGFFFFANGMVEKSIIFFKFMVLEREGTTVKLYPNPKIFKLQRRTNLRVRVSYVNKVFINLERAETPGVKYDARVFDISSGGLSFVTETDKESLFKNGGELKKISFDLLGKNITCDAIVRHTMITKDESRLQVCKVGIQFVNISRESDNVIAQYIGEESKHMFSALK